LKDVALVSANTERVDFLLSYTLCQHKSFN